MDRKLISAVLIGGVLAISFSAVLIRLAEAEPAVIAFYRLFFSAALLAPWALRQRGRAQISFSQLGLIFGAGVLLALHFLFWMTSLEHTSVASSVVLVTTQPLFVFLLSLIFLKETPARSMWAGLILALAGSIAVVFSQDSLGQSRLFGNVLALLGAVMMAAYFLVGRKVRQKVPLALYSALVYGASSVVLALFILLRGLPWAGYPGRTWLMFFLLALFPTVLGHNSLNWALEYLPATMVSIVILGEPIGASISAALILKEIPGWLELLGSTLILAGIFLVWRADESAGDKSPADLSPKELEQDEAGGGKKAGADTPPPVGS
ncbi:MAG TPA: DMT family transporter [Firmicutes bacterium]|nr:DMT family transporter [Bacillota bacterium]